LGMGEHFDRDELLEVPDIARYLKVSEVTVYRWCKEGRLPALKLGHNWRVRRSALEDFLHRGERSATLFGQLRSFYRVPDNVLAIAQTHEMLFKMDAALLGVGEARGGILAKFHGPQTEATIGELRAEIAKAGLDVERLEGEGRLRFVEEEGGGEVADHVEALVRFYEEESAPSGSTVWASFDWSVGVDPREAVETQSEVTRLSAQRPLVVQTGVLEEQTDGWPPTLGREAQLAHTATVWLSEGGIATTRVAPVAEA
jgi:excisionase family DNA binding protein